MRLTSLLKRRVIWARESKESIFDPWSWVSAHLVWSLKRELRTPTHTLFLKMKMIFSPALPSLRVPVFISLRRPGNVWPSSVCFPHQKSVCLFLGIVFLPNATLYWLCEFLRRNRPNRGREFRSLREIMGQSKEIYGAHIETKIRREKKNRKRTVLKIGRAVRSVSYIAI